MAKRSDPITTPEFRVSYPHLDQPSGIGNNKPKYSCEMLIPKTADIKPILQDIERASVERWGTDKKKWPLRDLPIKDGDKVNARAKEDGKDARPEIDGQWVVTARNAEKPIMIDRSKQKIEGKDIYAGSYARAKLRAGSYKKADVGKDGINFYLNAIQKTKDGERFGEAQDGDDLFDELPPLDDGDDLDKAFSNDNDDLDDL